MSYQRSRNPDARLSWAQSAKLAQRWLGIWMRSRCTAGFFLSQYNQHLSYLLTSNILSYLLTDTFTVLTRIWTAHRIIRHSPSSPFFTVTTQLRAAIPNLAISMDYGWTAHSRVSKVKFFTITTRLWTSRCSHLSAQRRVVIVNKLTINTRLRDGHLLKSRCKAELSQLADSAKAWHLDEISLHGRLLP